MDTREFNKLYNNIRNPYDEEDNQSMEFGQNIKTIPTGFSFGMNPPTLPTSKPGEEPVSGNFRDFKTMMSNINPQLGYTDSNYGANISGIMNPYTNAPKSYSAGAYYGPEQDRYNLGITTIPTAGIKQLSAGYEGPYGNFSLGASRDPMMGKNYTANYNYGFADGGRAGYADGTPMAGLAGKFTPVDPNSPPIPDSLLPTGVTNEISNLVYYGPKNNTIANWKGFSPDNPISPLVPVASPGKVLKPEYQNGIPLGLPMDSYFMDAPITSTQTPTQNITSNLPIDQITDLSYKDKLIRALSLAGFNSPEINSILAQHGYADGGDVGYQYGGGAIGYSEGGLAPITAGMPIAPGYARGGYISQGQPVNTDLTRTIPPVRGPMSQGVETLFKRRYS